ncbi:MAG: nuclear transport factor 2 family protein [Candidatus Binataceae bacterium]
MELKPSEQESLEVAEKLFKAIEHGDVAAVRALYAPRIKIWHNFDGATQTMEENLALLEWMVGSIAEVAYTDIRRQPTPTGFVQQHVLQGRVKSSGKAVTIPACMVGTIEDGKITRLDEYLDSAQIAAMRG